MLNVTNSNYNCSTQLLPSKSSVSQDNRVKGIIKTKQSVIIESDNMLYGQV